MVRSTAGFTLIEVMIATVVLSLVMLGALSAMRTLGQVEQRVVETTGRVNEMRAVSTRLRSLLEQAHSGAGGLGVEGNGGTWAGLQGLSSYYFDGTARNVSWMAPLAGVGGVSGLHYLRLRRQGGQLLLDIAEYRPRDESPDWGRSIDTALLADEVMDFSIAYRIDGEPGWQARFDDDSGALPAAVRIRIRSRERYWPDLVVAPAAFTSVDK